MSTTNNSTGLANDIQDVLGEYKELHYETLDSGYSDTGDLWALANRLSEVLAKVQQELLADKQERGGVLGEVIDRRMQVYGRPTVAFSEIAEMWSVYLGVPISAYQVTILMILMKVVRSKTSPDYSDHIDDIKGYADLFEKVMGEDLIKARTVNEYIEKKWPNG